MAFGLLIHQFLAGGAERRTEPGTQDTRACLDGSCSQCAPQVGGSLARVRNLLFARKLDLVAPLPLPADVDPLRPLLTHELCMQRISDQRLESLIATLAPDACAGRVVLAELSGLIQARSWRSAPITPAAPIRRSRRRRRRKARCASSIGRPRLAQRRLGMTVPRLRFD
ncbi:MAG: hypothetical protein M5U07_16800 [Xanthobacteraceae bacterium]|nr:hypothetical protein [Xanthobacteraceae bacterium]